MNKVKFNFLLSPLSIFLSIIGGILTGLYLPAIAALLKPAGDIYLLILKMCVIPIMAAAVVVSINKLVRSSGSSKYIVKLASIFFVFLIFVSVIGIAAGFITLKFSGESAELKNVVGNIMMGNNKTHSQIDSNLKSLIREIDSRYPELQKKEEHGMKQFIMNLIPENIFYSLAEGENMKIVFFFIVLGIMMKFISPAANISITSTFEGIFDAFQALIKFAMYFLPLGLFSLLADQFSKIGFQALSSMLNLIVAIYIASIMIFIISALIIKKYSGKKLSDQFSALKDAIVISLATRSSFASLPCALSGLVNGLNFNEERSKLTVSLGFTLCKYGKTLIFCITAIFAANLYEYTLSLESIIIIMVSSIFAGMAASGAPSIVSRGMIGMVLAPLGIPDSAIIVILLTIDPLVDPVITLISTYPNYAVAAIIDKAEL